MIIPDSNIGQFVSLNHDLCIQYFVHQSHHLSSKTAHYNLIQHVINFAYKVVEIAQYK